MKATYGRIGSLAQTRLNQQLLNKRSQNEKEIYKKVDMLVR